MKNHYAKLLLIILITERVYGQQQYSKIHFQIEVELLPYDSENPLNETYVFDESIIIPIVQTPSQAETPQANVPSQTFLQKIQTQKPEQREPTSVTPQPYPSYGQNNFPGGNQQIGVPQGQGPIKIQNSYNNQQIGSVLSPGQNPYNVRNDITLKESSGNKLIGSAGDKIVLNKSVNGGGGSVTMQQSSNNANIG